MLLKQKTAIITGCNRGIGRSMLETFASHGANIIACARNDSDSFTEHRAHLEAIHQVTITPVFFDLADSKQVQDSAKEIISQNNKIDILVNNAGIGAGAHFHMTPLVELKRVFEINFFSQLMFSQTISRFMTRFKYGSIINIASTAGLIGDAGTISYGSSKAALIFATKTMATELGPMNIRVNAIAPGLTKTDMLDQMATSAREMALQATALKRAADPSEVANLALYLGSDLSTYITGQVIRIDGGLTT